MRLKEQVKQTMQIQRIQQTSFGYSSPLKTLWLKNKLPTVKYGFYGDELTKRNVSLEHLKPHSEGGKTKLSNLVLASKDKNNNRGNAPLENVIDIGATARYLAQFRNVKARDFNGNAYIIDIIKTIGELINV